MLFVRIGWFVMLILAATTLPASAQNIPETDEAQDQTPENNKTDDTDKETSSVLIIIQTADIWNGGPTRTPVPVDTNMPAISGSHGPFGAHLCTGGSQTFTCVETLTPYEKTRKQWLASRYPHAPPHVRTIG